MKIAFILGTRPEIIKMSPLIEEVEKQGIDFVILHTGQHYDHEMSEQFFLDLELPTPDYNIGVGSGAHGKQTAKMIEGLEEVLTTEKPDMVLVEGDTNAVLAGALAASKMHIPVGHVEAGLRSYDKTMPEEINRMVADVCTELFFVPTKEAGLNLLFEGLNPHQIYVTGNTVVDACIRNLKIAKKTESLDIPSGKGDLITLTMHRAENVDDPRRLTAIIESVLELEDFNIIFPVHPRTAHTLQDCGLYQKLDDAEHINLIKPVGYLDFLLLLSNSRLILTDSGGIQEEAITLNIPCVTLRYNTERPETVTAGGNILVGADKTKIISNVNRILHDPEIYTKMSGAKNPYGDGNSSKMILDNIMTLYSQNKLKIEVPEDIMGTINRKLKKINEDIILSEFERKNSDLTVSMVFDNGDPIFPDKNLNLKDKEVLLLLKQI